MQLQPIRWHSAEDVTIIAEKPRLAGRKAETRQTTLPAAYVVVSSPALLHQSDTQDMKENIVRICDTIPARVNLKVPCMTDRGQGL